MKIKKGIIPNVLTCSRIVGAVLLIFTEPLSASFFVVYTLCGVTDVLDGLIARLEKSESPAGAVLDTIADLMFYSAMLINILPLLYARLPKTFWLCVGMVLVIRIISYGVGFAKYKRLTAMHTYGNKLTGLVLFLIPYVMKLEQIFIPCLIVCMAAGMSSGEELLIHLSSKEYSPQRKSIFFGEKRDAA